MKFLGRFVWPRSVRSEVLSLYKLGMARAERGDPQGAMDAYTLAVERAGAPDDIKAMALYNRALLFTAESNVDKALRDLQAVMQMPIPMIGVKLAARRRLERLHHRHNVQGRGHQPCDGA